MKNSKAKHILFLSALALVVASSSQAENLNTNSCAQNNCVQVSPGLRTLPTRKPSPQDKNRSKYNKRQYLRQKKNTQCNPDSLSCPQSYKYVKPNKKYKTITKGIPEEITQKAKKPKKGSNSSVVQNEQFSSNSINNCQFTIIPPVNWSSVIDKEQLPKHIQALFLAPDQSSPIAPSLCVVSETTELSQEEYVTKALNYHTVDKQGSLAIAPSLFTTNAGRATLFQVDHTSQWGDTSLVQVIIINNKTAYILTFACLKKEFSNHAPKVLKSIQSFSLNSVRNEKNEYR